MKLTGAQILIESLKKEGVEVIFGYPGGAVLNIYDEIHKADFKHILVRHEQGAVHAADGYARSSGKVGVCLVTSGPGATNTVTGLATAYMDSVPLVVFTGQVPTLLIGNDAFQEADVTGVTRPVTKHNYLVKRAEDIGRTVREAFHIARTGRPGPVLVDIAESYDQEVDRAVSTLVSLLEPALAKIRDEAAGRNITITDATSLPGTKRKAIAERVTSELRKKYVAIEIMAGNPNGTMTRQKVR